MRSYLIIGKDERESLGRFYRKNLQQMGHSVELFDVRDSFPLGSLGLKNFLIDFVERGKIDLRIPSRLLRASFDVVILTKDYLSLNVLLRLKKHWSGVKFILINPDPIWAQGSQLFLLNDYDFIFFKDELLVRRLRICNGMKEVMLLNEAYDEIHLRKGLVTINNCRVILFGNLKSHRVHLIRAISKSVDLIVYSPQYKSRSYLLEGLPVKLKPGIYEQEKTRVISESFCVINDMNVAEAHSFNAKFIEIAASGGFQLIPFSGFLANKYPWMKAIMYKNPENLVEKLNHYRNATDERITLIEKIRQLILPSFGYESNINRINDIVFGNNTCK